MRPVITGLAVSLHKGFVYFDWNREWHVTSGMVSVTAIKGNVACFGHVKSRAKVGKLIQHKRVHANIDETPFGYIKLDGHGVWSTN